MTAPVRLHRFRQLHWVHWSLRTKLIAIITLIQLIATALVMLGSTQLFERTLAEQAAYQSAQVTALLAQSIAEPLVQRDYATIQQILDSIRAEEAINYLVLWDYRGKLIATSGWDMARTLPLRDSGDLDLSRPGATLHLSAPVSISSQLLGHVDLGISTQGLSAAQHAFFIRSLIIAAITLALSIMMTAALAIALTRRLTRLQQASERIAGGNFDEFVAVDIKDEIGNLAVSFNTMAKTLKDRLSELEASKVKQGQHLESVRREETRLSTLLEAMSVSILFVDTGGMILYANDSFKRVWRVSRRPTGRSLNEVITELASHTLPADIPSLKSMLYRQPNDEPTTAELHTLDGRIITQRIQALTGVYGDIGHICFHEDVTLEKQTMRLAREAMFDPLTNLFNRRGFYESIGKITAEADTLVPFSHEQTALMFLDLDNFKHANDIGGHHTGDAILVAVAQKLSEQVREGDIVARLGGDEFAIVCPGISATECSLIAARIVSAISALRFPAKGQYLQVGCSIGIAIHPLHARTEDELVACADAAMYEVKKKGKNGWMIYQDTTHRGADLIEPERLDYRKKK
jgi:diguanylate cyclase (GGDEF)-like protein